MSSLVARLADQAAEACTRAAWAQRRELAAPADGGAGRAVVVDPEALAGFARRGVARTSVGGPSAMVDRRRVGTDRSPALPFPDPQRDAATKGRCGDAAAIPAPAGRRAKGSKELTLSGPAASVLKLRAAFGVSAKAHVLAFLIAGAEGFGARQGLSVDETARALAYSAVSVRRALQEMVLSGLVTVAPTGPARYATNVPGWTALSGFGPTDLGGRGAKARDFFGRGRNADPVPIS